MAEANGLTSSDLLYMDSIVIHVRNGRHHKLVQLVEYRLASAFASTNQSASDFEHSPVKYKY